MLAIMKERQITEAQQEMLELEEQAPEKFDAEFEFKVNKHASDRSRETRYRTLTREECAALLAASNAPFEPEVRPEPVDYPTLPREEAERLVREHFEYKERERLKKEKEWDSQKTIESVTKTVTKTKRSTSTKASK